MAVKEMEIPSATNLFKAINIESKKQPINEKRVWGKLNKELELTAPAYIRAKHIIVSFGNFGSDCIHNLPKNYFQTPFIEIELAGISIAFRQGVYDKEPLNMLTDEVEIIGKKDNERPFKIYEIADDYAYMFDARNGSEKHLKDAKEFKELNKIFSFYNTAARNL